MKVGLMTLLFGLALMTGCSTHTHSLAYSAPLHGSSQPREITVAVGTFVDARGTDARWLGAIRGGYGNVLKKLYTDVPVSDAVANAVRDAIGARQWTVTDEATHRLEGRVVKFDANYFFNREAHAHLEFRVVDRTTGAQVFSREYRMDNTEPGAGAGIFGSPTYLAEFAQRTLNEAIDQALGDPGLHDALSGSAGVSQPKAISKRLGDLLRGS